MDIEKIGDELPQNLVGGGEKKFTVRKQALRATPSGGVASGSGIGWRAGILRRSWLPAVAVTPSAPAVAFATRSRR